jgi:hypothetical protein
MSLWFNRVLSGKVSSAPEQGVDADNRQDALLAPFHTYLKEEADLLLMQAKY